MGELCIGGRYELVVTNSQGLFRYRMGDALRCVGFFGGAPKVRALPEHRKPAPVPLFMHMHPLSGLRLLGQHHRTYNPPQW